MAGYTVKKNSKSNILIKTVEHKYWMFTKSRWVTYLHVSRMKNVLSVVAKSLFLIKIILIHHFATSYQALSQLKFVGNWKSPPFFVQK